MSKTNNHTIQDLTQFRLNVETEAETSINNIPTDLALALADIAEGLGISDPDDLLGIMGAEAYRHAYVDPIPYRPAHPPLHKVQLLLAQLRDAWTGKWADAFPTAPPAA